ncbi:hypothetical protein ACJ3XI_04060 [Litorimonas sp. RW-G-Af-16]|uniref:hypothetical protein n=1 Tax=Litorimonas sp. RW-G-Af-16 TaxID=3241168 RepID=UPI00390C662B
MIANLLPAVIMFAITVSVATLFFVPVTRFPAKNELINFYWAGFWVFLAVIASIAGGVNTLMIVDFNSYAIANALLFATISCFICFVVFGWFRLSATALLAGAARIKARF